MDKDITWDNNGAYAIIVTEDRETGSKFDVFHYNGTGVEGASKIFNKMIYAPNCVRVLREYTSNSPFAPPIGLRYEGLYGMISSSLTELIRTDTV